MNQTAQKLGLKDSHFANVDGLPDPEEYVTAHDLATLARDLIRDFPEYFHYDAEKEFTYNGIKQGNRNPLLYKDLGVDGMKTGHTEEAGYGITVTALRQGRRIIEVLSGMKSMNMRSAESEKLLSWAYREWANYRLVKAGDTVDEAPVWLGVTATVPATVASDVVVSMPRNARNAMKVTAIYDKPAPAPIAPGQEIGSLQISAPDMTPVSVPLVAAKADDKVGGLSRAALAAGYLVFGKKN